MTERLPFVNVAGTLSELPAGDDLNACLLASLTQLLGYTPANILEVEANTRAARVTYRPRDEGSAREQAFNVSHHSIGAIIAQNTTTTWPTNAEIFTAGNPGYPMIAFLQKMTVAMATNLVSGARLGQTNVRLFQINPLIGLGSAFRWSNPVWQGGEASNSANTRSLRTNQEAPQLIITFSTSANPATTLATGVVASKSIGEAQGEAKSAIGTNIRPTVIYDHQTHGPFILMPFTGIMLAGNVPPAATSQQVFYSVNMQWLEWQPRTEQLQ